MSTTTILPINLDGSAPTAEPMMLRNSHGTGPLIWGIIAKEYFGVAEVYQYSRVIGPDFWKLHKDTSIPFIDRVIFAMTFDGAVIAKEHFKRAADDIDAFLEKYYIPKTSENHWPAIAKFLRTDPACDSIGFVCSMAGSLFHTYNDETDEDIFTDENIFSVYELDHI